MDPLIVACKEYINKYNEKKGGLRRGEVGRITYLVDCAKGEDGVFDTMVVEGELGALLRSPFVVGATSTLRVRGRSADTSGSEGAK